MRATEVEMPSSCCSVLKDIQTSFEALDVGGGPAPFKIPAVAL